MAAGIFISFLILSSISLTLRLPLPLKLICGFIQVFFLPGFVTLVFFGGKKRPWQDYIYFSMLLSPVIFVLLLVIISFFTDSFGLSLSLTASLSYAFLAASLFSGKIRLKYEQSSIPGSILIVSLAYSAVIAAAYSVNGLLLVRSDAWYHASVVTEILSRGIPPSESWLPDMPIRYMWIYHLFLASWKELSGLSLFRAMGAFNILAAFSLPYLASRIISRYTSNRKYILLVSCMAVAGFESASWILWPISLGRSFFGEVRGMAEVTRQFKLMIAQLNSCEVIRFLRPYRTWMVNLTDKNLTVTAFGYSLDLFLLGLIFTTDHFIAEGKRILSASMIFLSILGCFLFHVITGTALLLTILGTSFIIPVLSRIFSGAWSGIRKWAPVSCAAIAAGLIGFPYFASLGGGGGGEGGIAGYIHIGFTNIATILIPIVILLPPLRRAFKRIFDLRRMEFTVTAAFIVCLAVLNIFVNLPTRNESKLIYPFFLVIGIPVYLEIVKTVAERRGMKRVILTLWFSVLLLIPPVLTIRGFILDRGYDPSEARRYMIDDEDRLLFDWIRENTGRDAVIAEANNHHLIAVHAGRHCLYSDRGVMKVLGYGGEKYELYGKINDIIFSGEEFDIETASLVSSTGLDIYVVLWEEDVTLDPLLDDRFDSMPAFFSKVFENGKARIYRFEIGSPAIKE